jgi:coenzyme F420-reducing hydrogenase delta subunit
MSNIGAAIAPSGNGRAAGAQSERVVVVFICENVGRPGVVPSSGIRRRPTTPDFAWPFPVKEVVVPCAGRLQPEHFLKAFEDGADAIGVICCEEGNCHHLEGNRRCGRRLDHVDGLLKQIGLGENRLKMFQLPGSAKEDMALGLNPNAVPTLDIDPVMSRKVAAVRDAFVAHLATVSPNPMRTGALPDESPNEVDSEDESDE